MHPGTRHLAVRSPIHVLHAPGCDAESPQDVKVSEVELNLLRSFDRFCENHFDPVFPDYFYNGQ